MSDDERINELTDMVEDLAGNLEDAADTIERAAQAILPGLVVRDADAYREIARKARRLV